MRTPVTGSVRMVGNTEVILGLAVRTQMKLGCRNDFKALIKMHLNGGGGVGLKRFVENAQLTENSKR
jgi:hypothetical protein